MAKHNKAKKAHKKKRGGPASAKEHVLDRLYSVIDSRKDADPDTSYTARLFSRGLHQIAKKLGAEAVKAVNDRVRCDRSKLDGQRDDSLTTLMTLLDATYLNP